MNNIKKTVAVLLIIAMTMLATGCGSSVSDAENGSDIEISTEIEAARNPDVEEVASDEDTADFELRMLDVKQGLAVLIKADDKYLLYDGGGRYTSSYVVSYLKKHGVDELEYMVASHYDEDHIFGLVGVLSTTKVGFALTPDYTTDTEVYSSFRRAMERSNVNEVHPETGDSYELGGASIKILGPESYDADEDNDKSIAVRISYGDFSVIITGDQSADGESDIISSNGNIQSTLYIVGHHGSSHSSSKAFLRRVAPAYAFISVGADNDYGHPTDDCLKRLDDVGCKIYRTDLNGEITAYYDGEKLWLETEKENGDSQADSTAADSTGDEASAAKTTYVLNTNTMKFHYPTCHSVDDMADHNKQYSESTRDELIEQGYSPCGNCRP